MMCSPYSYKQGDINRAVSTRIRNERLAMARWLIDFCPHNEALRMDCVDCVREMHTGLLRNSMPWETDDV